MLEMYQEQATASEMPSIKAAEAKKLEKVSPNKYWRVTYQLGPCRSFGKAFPSAAWKEKKDALGGESTFDPVYRVYDQILDSGNVNGLVVENNEWQAANIRQKVEGDINRMLIVLDIKEMKDYLPPNVTFLQGGMPMQVLQMIVDAAVESRLKASTGK